MYSVGTVIEVAKAQMALKANCTFAHSWEAKHVRPAKPL